MTHGEPPRLEHCIWVMALVLVEFLLDKTSPSMTQGESPRLEHCIWVMGLVLVPILDPFIIIIILLHLLNSHSP